MQRQLHGVQRPLRVPGPVVGAIAAVHPILRRVAPLQVARGELGRHVVHVNPQVGRAGGGLGPLLLGQGRRRRQCAVLRAVDAEPAIVTPTEAQVAPAVARAVAQAKGSLGRFAQGPGAVIEAHPAVGSQPAAGCQQPRQRRLVGHLTPTRSARGEVERHAPGTCPVGKVGLRGRRPLPDRDWTPAPCVTDLLGLTVQQRQATGAARLLGATWRATPAHPRPAATRTEASSRGDETLRRVLLRGPPLGFGVSDGQRIGRVGRAPIRQPRIDVGHRRARVRDRPLKWRRQPGAVAQTPVLVAVARAHRVGPHSRAAAGWAARAVARPLLPLLASAACPARRAATLV
eukprot:scaffold345_cov104-Isochrysis_galbana.AAC.9